MHGGSIKYIKEIMQIISVFSNILLLILIPVFVCAENIHLDELIIRIQKTYQGIENIRASFYQKSVGSISRYQQTFSGTLYLKKPNLVRMDVVHPQEQRIIITEKESWIYIPDDNQAMVSAAPPELQTIFSFLMGGGDEIRERYHINLAKPESEDIKGNHLLVVEEKADPKTRFDKIVLTIRKKDFYILQARLFNLSGDGIQLELKKIKVNKKLDNALFIFKPPKGVEVQRIGE